MSQICLREFISEREYDSGCTSTGHEITGPRRKWPKSIVVIWVVNTCFTVAWLFWLIDTSLEIIYHWCWSWPSTFTMTSWWARWRLKSPASRLFTQNFVQAQIKNPKLRVTGFCEGNSPSTGDFPAQRASNAENVSIWWRHHDRTVMVQSSISTIFHTGCTLHWLAKHVNSFSF